MLGGIKIKAQQIDKIDMLVYMKVCKLIDRAEEGLNQTKKERNLVLNSREVQGEMT